ncbi:MAG TPA: hypothetical protein VII78_10140 [Myxococcota bacterium]|jgi:hypothetical protein
MNQCAALDELPRATLLRVALETMHVGHLVDRALMPQVFLATRDVNTVDQVAIDEWMGASPVYTGRMRRLMKIEGDGVPAIVKALQLDCGFPHQYMDVGWKLIDDAHGEFFLLHCGALMDVEPHGEARVVGMCHTIEDPTFDATAYATNPRARIRPIHRPPRTPKDRHPHCHWTIEIDAANEPVGPAKNTRAVAALPLAQIENTRAPERDAGWTDYTRPAAPGFKLGHLSSATLAAVAREFQIQVQLLACSAELALAERIGADKAREALSAQWSAVGWHAGARLARALGVAGGGADGVARVLRLHAALPPGFSREIAADGERVRVALAPQRAELLDPAHAGWLGLLARGEGRGIECAAQGADPRARLLALEVRAGRIEAELAVSAGAEPAKPPQAATLMSFSTATSFAFDTSEARLGR